MITTHSPLKLIRELVILEREDILTLMAYGIGIGLMSLATPVAVQTLVNTVAFGALFQPLVVLSVILFVLVGFSNMLSGLQFYAMDVLQRRVFVRLFGETARRLQRAHITGSDHHYLPELVNRFLDVVTLNKSAATILLETIGYILQTAIGMLLLAFYHPMLLAFDLFLLMTLSVIIFVLGKHGIQTAIEQSKAKYEVLAWLENMANNLVINKSAAADEFLEKKTERIAQNYLNAYAKHFTILARQNTSGLVLHTIANTLLLAMGGWMVIDRQLSLGQLIAAELIVSNMMYGLTRLGKTFSNFYTLFVSADKIEHLLDIPQENNQGKLIITSANRYQVDIYNVSLPKSSHLDVIQGLELHLKPGESMVISDGSSRGSLLDILYGLRLPSSGYVRLNEHDLRDLNLRLLRDKVCLVRDVEIIEASILENLSLGRNVELSLIWDTLEKVGLRNLVSNLSGGLNHQLTSSGKPFTNEQALRLTLARAMIATPGLLLLDGTLDRIDQRILPQLVNNLFAEYTPWTLIVTGRHPLAIAACQRYACIEKGVLVEKIKN
jgi:putative ABC transport system ATP-binding protein